MLVPNNPTITKHKSPNQQTDKPNAQQESHKKTDKRNAKHKSPNQETDKPNAQHNLLNGINIADILKAAPYFELNFSYLLEK